jgi:site-specific recombinase XerC
MVGMKPPQLPDEPPPVLTDDQLRRLLKSCDGCDFAARRYTAIIRLFIDTGVRVSEAAGIMLPDDLNLDDQVVIVLGKGRRQRAVPFGRKTPWHWTAIFVSAPATSSRICPTCGSAHAAP